jgi:N,N-dimethylformamidase
VELMVPGQGGSDNPRVRADMVLVNADNGGFVFSVGSIAWSLGLAENDDDNNVSRVTQNVLRRALADRSVPPVHPR